MSNACKECGKEMTLIFQFFACDWCDGIREWDDAVNDDTDEITLDFMLGSTSPPTKSKSKYNWSLPPLPSPLSGSASLMPNQTISNPFLLDLDDDDELDDLFSSSNKPQDFYDYSDWGDDD